jgi:hypothetical protein
VTWENGHWKEPDRRADYPLPRVLWADIRDLPRILKTAWDRLRSRLNW